MQELKQAKNEESSSTPESKAPPIKTAPKSKSKVLFASIGIIIILALAYLFYKSLNNNRVVDQSLDKSIAVLYFDNMSGDPEQEYFSDGMTEEIIAHFAKIEELKVISRNSVKVYKGQPLNVKEIAEKLGVSAILEGSVRKSGNRVRITAQLINAQTDEHIWADIFERELTDIFQVGKGSVKYNN